MQLLRICLARAGRSKIVDLLPWQQLILDLSKDDDEGNGGDEMDKMMDLAGDKAKEEEIQAICKSRGISQDAPLSLQLKALDEEYHYLLEHGLSAKAEYVQTLYEWKSKQCIQVDVTSSNSSEGEYLGKAYLKYCDALACDPNNYQLHMHVGRHLLLQKDYDGAIVRLEAAVGLNPTNVDARFYLGLAYAKKFGRTFQRPGEIIRYLSSGIEFAMFKLQEDVEFDLPLCTADIFARLSNILLFEGMYELAHFMRDKSNCLVDKERKKIVELLTEASVLALHFMNGVSHRGYTYIQLKWAVVRVQYTLGLHLMTELKRQANMSQKELDEMQKYWERLSAITRAFELPCDKEVLAIERKICEEAVVLRPSCSQALYRLGDAQLLCYDNDPIGNPEMLREAEVSYRVSIELEGKPANDPSTHYDIVVTEWWKNKLEKDKMLKPTTAKAKHPEKKMTNTKPMHKNETSVKGKGTPGKNQTSTAAKTAGRGGTQSSKGQGAATVPPRQSSNVSSKNASTSNKGKASTSAATTAKASPTKTASHRHGSKQTEIPSTSSRHHGKTSPTKAPEKKESVKSVENKENKQLSKETKEETTVSSTQELNKPTYHSRLGLARLLVRSSASGSSEQIEALYNKVIEMAPFVHDAYIEIGEIFMRTDPLKAVDIYCKFPFGGNLSYDDAYLHGEIIRILIKGEKYKDPRLESSMIAYGKVMGFPVLEKYVVILESQAENLPMLCRVYAGINNKDVDDKELQDFFKFKYWI